MDQHTGGDCQASAEIKEESGIENPDVKQFSDLRQTHEQSLEFAVDRKRVRFFMDSPGHCRQVKVWDGNELRIHEKYYDRTQEQYILDNMIPPRMFHELLSCNYGWPRSQPHSFWYDVRDVNNGMEFYGPADRFNLIGQEMYRETPCCVLEYEVPAQWKAGSVWRWFVGRSDGLLHGIQDVYEGQVRGEHWWSDYRQVVPGGCFPRHGLVHL